MMSVLRIGSMDFDVDSFLRGYPRFCPEAVWHKGEVGVTKRQATTNGFNLLVAKYERWTEVLASSLEFCALHGTFLQDARKCRAELELDFRVEPGEGGAWAVSARLAPSELSLLASAGIALCVTAYPPSRLGGPTRE
jgi:hypothetical protein